jgi:hypothetical protein
MSAELLGLPAEVECGGRTYRLGPPTQKAKAILEELLAGAAVANVAAMKAYLPAAEYREAYDAVVRAVGAGLYKTGTKGWLDALQSPDGLLAFTLSLFRVNHPTMTRAECETLVGDHGDAVNAAMARVAPDFFRMAFPGLPADVLAEMAKAMSGNAN